MLPERALHLALDFAAPPNTQNGLVLLVGVTWLLSAVLLGLAGQMEHLGKRWIVRGLFCVAFWVSMSALSVLFELR